MIESVASGGRPLNADETVEALADAFADTFYLIADWSYEPLSDDLLIVTTTVRHRSSRGGFSHYVLHRATVGRNGLMFRVKLFQSRADALAFLKSYGAARAAAVAPTPEVVTVLNESLRQAAELMRANAGSVQLYDPDASALTLHAHLGVSHPFTDYFQRVSAYDPCACGSVLRGQHGVWLRDLDCAPEFADESRDVLHSVHLRSVASVPIKSNNRQLVGVISTHRRLPGSWARPERRALQSAALSLAQTLGLLGSV